VIELVVYSTRAGELYNMVMQKKPACFVSLEQALEMQKRIEQLEDYIRTMEGVVS
jgi:hypothetical protein